MNFAEYLEKYLIDPEQLTEPLVPVATFRSPVNLRELAALCKRHGVDVNQPLSRALPQLAACMVPDTIARATKCRENAARPRSGGKLDGVDIRAEIAALTDRGKSERDAVSILCGRYGTSRQAIHQRRKRQSKIAGF